ncbi:MULTISPECIES: hypothetical protein [Vibrio]|uniref:hypothetical protein n=1 Tax=Vibrio TaxID=662 RepID=UPI000D657B2D|nr:MULTISPECIES: hypothetical protein [Vibrio]NAW54343.1 hypothetical protein [Vibrio sp. V41_P2S12T139]NAW94139.1 hypothetical protein [Vibrio sp. V42_P2S4T144]MCR9306484.1 hypothetical protein [Vibrio diabolicus]MCS0376609.1 hypothetical protein [Vibrio diabolicus]PWF69576.1 hypothetical protein CBX98_20180 [Vibrio sp. T9]
MADKRSNFNKRIEAIHLGAQAMRNLCIESQFDSQTGMFLTDDNSRGAAILSAIANEPMFESVSQETAVGIVSGMQSAVREYEKTYGHLPSDELMASAHATMRNMMTLEGAKRDGSTGAMMLESIGQSLSTSEGVEIRAKMVGLVLPVLLETATLDAVTMIPAGANEVEIFKVYRRTGSNFGDFAAGTEIDQATVGQYSSMRQRYKFVAEQQPDGTKKTHVFDSKTDLQHTKFEIPFTKTSVSLFINHKRVARDLDSNGSQIMTGTHNGMVINCQIDHAKGKVTVTPTSALPAETVLHIEFEVDIERRPDLIPTIDHDMDSRILRPRQNAIAADATIQAMFTMQREFGQDLKSLQMSHMRNTLASEKATRHLVDMDFACTREETFNIYVAAGEDWRLHRERLNEVLLNVSTKILQATRTTGMTGIFAGTGASTILKSLGAPYFVAPANYQQKNAIHYAGKLFGMWKVFECPVVIGTNDMLCYGRGSSHSEAGYVAGDAIAATMYTHPIGKGLVASNTLYELAYGEIHPFDGEDYFYRVRLIDEAPVAEAA